MRPPRALPSGRLDADPWQRYSDQPPNRSSIATAALIAVLLAGQPVRADDVPPPPEPLGDPAEIPAPLPPPDDPAEDPASAPPPAEPRARPVPIPEPAAAAAPAHAPLKKKQLPTADEKPADEGLLSTLGWGTVGGGAVAAVAVGGLAMLGCQCSAPAACAVATCGFASGALIGHLLEERPWSARALIPAGAAAAVGVAAGTVTTVVVVVTPMLMDAAMPDPGVDPDAALANNLAAGGVTALAAGATLVVGGLIAGAVATSLARATDEPAERVDPAPSGAKRPHRGGAQEPAADGFGY